MRTAVAFVLLIGIFCCSSHGRSIAPLDDPYAWSNELVWDSSRGISLILKYKENGELSATFRLGRRGVEFADEMPVLAGTLLTNIFTDYFYAQYGVGLNAFLVNGVVTGDTNGDFKYSLKSMFVILTKILALGGALQGEGFNIETFGVDFHTFGVNTQVRFDNNLSVHRISTDY